MEPWMMAALPAAGLALFVAIVLVTKRNDRARTEALADWAPRNGWSVGDPSSLQGTLQVPLVRSHRRGRCRNLLTRTHDSGEQMLFDYDYTRSSGNHSRHVRQTAFARRAREPIPAFELRPENVGHRIASMFGFADIDFEHRPDFSRRYLLRGKNEGEIRRLFGVEQFRFFEKEGHWTVESDGEWLIVYQFARRRGVEELRPFLGEGENIAALFLGG